MTGFGGYGFWGWMSVVLAVQGYQVAYVLAQTLVGWLLHVEVETISLGFGPRLAGFRWRGPEWRLSWIPLGGYTKFAGESPDDEGICEEHRFDRLKSAQKVMVASAGPLSNILLGILVLVGSCYVGRQEPRFLEEPARIGWLRPASSIERARLMAGDEVVSVSYGGSPVAVRSWRDFLQVLSRAYGCRISLSCRRGAEMVLLEADPSTAPLLDVAHRVPAEGGSEAQSAEPARLATLSWGDSFRTAIADAIEGIGTLQRWFLKQGQFAGRVTPDNRYGRLLAHRFAAGPSRLVVFLGLLGLFFGLYNLVPVPTLNGGLIAMTCLETLIGHPLSYRLKEALFKIGFLVVLPSMIYVIYRLLT